METKKDNGIVLNDVDLPFAVHPGMILQDELKARKIKQIDFAKQIGMEAPHLSALIHGTRNITAAIARRLEEALEIPATVWLNLQTQYNLSKERLDRRRDSALVSGYQISEESRPALILADPGDQRAVRVVLPDKDMALLQQLASRLGWHLEVSDSRSDRK